MVTSQVFKIGRSFANGQRFRLFENHLGAQTGCRTQQLQHASERLQAEGYGRAFPIISLFTKKDGRKLMLSWQSKISAFRKEFREREPASPGDGSRSPMGGKIRPGKP